MSPNVAVIVWLVVVFGAHVLLVWLGSVLY